MNAPLLVADRLTKHFVVRRGLRHAVVRAADEIDLELNEAEIVAVIGESGSGKSTLARLFAGLYRPTSGELRVDGRPVRAGRSGPARAHLRAVQLMLQDPFASLNPLRTVRFNLERPLRIHGHARTPQEATPIIEDLLVRVQLVPAGDFVDKRPHELSGGQRQRVVIARALAVRPRVLLADEPISMLDVSIRLDILNLLARLRDTEGLAIVYITHDIASARYLSDRAVVMYAGELVEGGPTDALIAAPRHPYTRLLVSSAPNPDGRDGPASAGLAGPADAAGSAGSADEPPDLSAPPPGCRFHPRCPLAIDRCRSESPVREDLGDGRWVRCWRAADTAPETA